MGPIVRGPWCSASAVLDSVAISPVDVEPRFIESPRVDLPPLNLLDYLGRGREALSTEVSAFLYLRRQLAVLRRR